MAAAPCKLDEFLAKELARHHPGAQAPPTLAEMVNIEVIDPVFFPHNLQQSIYTEVLPAYRKTVAACGNVAKNPGNSESESARDEVLTAATSAERPPNGAGCRQQSAEHEVKPFAATRNKVVPGHPAE
jgi:hypothetical protein